jgi:hypothetical protein
VLRNIFGARKDEVTGEWRRMHTEDIRDLYCLPNVIVVIISRRTMCVGMWSGWCAGILWFVVGKLEGTNNLEPLGIDGRVILNGYARNGLSLDWDDVSLDSDLCQAVVKTTVNHWVV